MKLRQLIEWIDTLPEEFLDYDLVSADWGVIDEQYTYRYDKPISALDVDEQNKEILIMFEAEKENNNNE